MWLSRQQKRPNGEDGGRTGTVTSAEGQVAVRLDSEVRGLAVYGPGGYTWTPGPGQEVLVIKGRGERPCVAGVKQGSPAGAVAIQAGTIALNGAVTVNGVPLEQYILALTGGRA